MYCTVEHNVRVPRWLWPELHCCPIAENSAKKLKYSGKKILSTARNWSETLAETALLFLKNILIINIQ
jgi:hypothetical protein